MHRDVTPSNLLVTTADGREAGKVADFGLARVYQASILSGITMADTGGGTPSFMPPEQVTDFRRVAPAGDQWSAAATLDALLSGQSPHGAGDPVEVFARILTQDPAPLRSLRAEVPAGLETPVHRALARKPEHRFPDVGAFRRAIAGFAGTGEA